MILYQFGDLEASRLRQEHPSLPWQEKRPGSCEGSDPTQVDGAIGSIEWTRALFCDFGWKVDHVGGLGCPVRHAVSDLYRRPAWMYRLGQVRPGQFVKPLPADMKAWTGQVATQAFLDDLVLAHGEDLEVEVQEDFRFRNEWRLFFARQNYRGRPMGFRLLGGARYPVPYDGVHVMDGMLRGQRVGCPAFAITGALSTKLNMQTKVDAVVVDVGQSAVNGEWCVVEIGDVWAMGSYGAGRHYLSAHQSRLHQLRSETISDKLC